MLGRQYHYVDRVHPEPWVEIIISVLYEEGFQEVIIERGVVVSNEEELVFFIKFVHVFGQHVHEFNVHLSHGRISLYLFLGHVANAKRFFLYLTLGVWADIEIKRFLRNPINYDLPTYLVDAISPVFYAGSL